MKLKLALLQLTVFAAADLCLGQPIITQQPANQPLSLGSDATFQVAASGLPPVNFQWRFNAAAILGATNASLKLTSAQLTNAGNYTVVVADSTGSVTSQVGRLDIIPTFARIDFQNLNDPATVAWMDYDGDGDLDLVVGNGVATSGQNNNLYRNNGDGTFTQITTGPVGTDLGTTLSAAWGDYDNDGWPDLLFGEAFGPDQTVGSLLYRNNGDATFARIGDGALVTKSGNYVASWGDYDNDGFLDVFLCNTGGNNFLFRNNAGGTFIQTNGSGLPQTHASGGNVANGVIWADYDNDGYLDLFLFGGAGRNSLFHNNGNGKFTPVNQAPFNTDSGPSVGAAWGDYDNDGFLDLFVANGNFDDGQRRNYLYHNNGNGAFTKITTGRIATDTGSCITAAWEDFDNDGLLDLFVPHNGGNSDAQKNTLYHNDGDGTFTSVSASSLVSDSGRFNAIAWGDYDNDGFPDLYVSAYQPGDALYHNGGNSNNWLSFKLIGTVSNRSAIGAKVRVKTTIRGRTFLQMREISNGDGFAGNSFNPHFGLGDATTVDSVRIEWPSHIVQEFQNIAARQFLTVIEPPRWHVSTTNGVPQFALRGGRNMPYDIQTSVNLTNWSLLRTLTITNLNGTALITDPNGPASDTRFYRAVLH